MSKYKPGDKLPTGETQFRFQVGNFDFRSTSYDWLAVSSWKAQFKGLGAVNGVSGYAFLLTAYDGDEQGGDGVDRFRIKIWRVSDNVVVYDNRFGAPDDLSGADPQALSGGSIVIHRGK